MDILIVDDHQLFAAGLRVLLAELSPKAQVTVKHSVADALASACHFDLILLDLHLPDAIDFDGLKRVKEFFEAAPIVVLSSEENLQKIRECIQRGAMGFLPKSSSPETLLMAMSRILDGKTYLPLEVIAADAGQGNQKPGFSSSLSPRQHEVLLKVIQGKPNKVIAKELGISDQTVKSHVMAVLAVLGVSNRTEAVYRAAALGLSAALV